MRSRIRPLTPESNTTPWCEWTVNIRGIPSWMRARRLKANQLHGLREDQCNKRSSYAIDGKHLCATHAGMQALKMVMEEE